MKRLALLALFIATVLAATVEPARAKLPPWTCEFATTRPVVGHRVDVVVRFWGIPPAGGPIHIRPDRFWRIPSIPGFLEAEADSSGAAGHRTLAGAIRFVRPGVYRARIIFPDTSTYRVEACDDSYDERGYPAGDGLQVGPRAFVGADAGRAGSPAEPSGIRAPLVVAGLGAAALVATERRRRSRRFPAGR